MIQSKTQRLTFQEKLYIQNNIEEIGRCHDPEKWDENAAKRKHLSDQTKKVASKLHEGFTVYGLGWDRLVNLDPYQYQDLFIFGLHSRQYKKLDGYKNINFLPSVAQKNRSQKTKEMELFLKHNKNERMWTFTAGPRCNLSQLQKKCRWMHRKISKLNDQPFMKELGARFVFRATEFGELASNGHDDISLHPHMHALLHLERYLRPDDWSFLLKRIQAFWGVYCKDCGKIRNSRELVKYCVKPSDLDGLNNVQLNKLYHATDGLRLWESLRDFRKMRRNIREEKKKVVIRKGVPRLVPNWNGGTSKKPKEKRLYGLGWSKTISLVLPRWIDSRTTEAIESERLFGKRSRPLPKIVSWCAPAPVFTPVSEPLFIVHGLDGRSPADFFKTEQVLRMEHFIRVHTKTLTVPKTFKNNNEENKIYESKPKISAKSTAPPRVHSVFDQPV